MQRRSMEALRMRGATGLLIAVLAGLLLIAAPPSFRESLEGLPSSAAAHSATGELLASASPSGEEVRSSRFSPDPRGTALNLDPMAQPTARRSLSSGALGMCLLALGSLVLLIAGLILRTAEGHQGQGVRRHR